MPFPGVSGACNATHRQVVLRVVRRGAGRVRNEPERAVRVALVHPQGRGWCCALADGMGLTADQTPGGNGSGLTLFGGAAAGGAGSVECAGLLCAFSMPGGGPVSELLMRCAEGTNRRRVKFASRGCGGGPPRCQLCWRGGGCLPPFHGCCIGGGRP